MYEVKKCSLSGVAFTMDADAYDALSGYLESLRNTYKDTSDGGEIVADIEARIAELILSTQDSSRVVEKPLILNIIGQMGSAEDISDGMSERNAAGEPRIPRRLYRDTENAKLGGVCAGIGRYFDIDPVWVRLAMFLPLILSCFGWIPFLHWSGPMMGNLFGIFVICYLIMWFAVPAARTARQKLEMTGERITAQSIGETTAAAAGVDPDSRAKPIVAEAVSVFGQVVLILLKIFAGLLVFGLIVAACALIIGLFAFLVGGHEMVLAPSFLQEVGLWIPILGILVVLIPVILLIYVLMCMIASRKPGGRTVLAIFLVWLATIIVLSVLAIRGNVGEEFGRKRKVIERALESEVVVDGQPTTLQRLLEDYDDESFIEEGRRTLHISIPSKEIDISVDKRGGRLQVNGEVMETDGNDAGGGESDPSPSARKPAAAQGAAATGSQAASGMEDRP